MEVKAFPYKIKPWQHQLDIIEKAIKRPHYAIFAEMGTGKTKTSIEILRHIFYREKRLLRTLILCPPVVCENWKREIIMHSKCGDDTHVLRGSQKERCKLMVDKINHQVFGDMPQPAIVVTNYESLLMKDLFKLLKGWCPEAIIYDESHKLKNYKSKRTRAAIELADGAKYNYILSGTPILNSPMDVFSQFRIMDKGATFGKNFFAFRSLYFYDKNAGMPKDKYFPNWTLHPQAVPKLNEKINAKASRVFKKDCLTLPPLVKKRVYVDLTPKQRKLYDEMKNHFIAFISENTTAIASIALTKALRLQQIITGFLVDDLGKTVDVDAKPRLEALESLLEEITPEHKAIVWACFKDNYSAIAKVCEKLGVEYATLYGGMSDKQRQQNIDKFQDDESTRVIIANQQAGGVGVNLTRASYAIYFSRNFSLEADIQSEARNHRGGSQQHVSITRLDLVAKDTLDEAILEALARKESMANQILNKSAMQKALGGST